MKLKYTLKLKYRNKSVIKEIAVKDCLDRTHGSNILKNHIRTKYNKSIGFDVLSVKEC